MCVETLPPQSAAGFEKAKPACQILILHEHYAAYTAAVNVCGRVMDQVEDAVDFGIKAWSFVELTDSHCARLVAKTAATADVIIFSMQSRAVPAELKRWLARYFTVRFKSSGLIALLHGSQGLSRQAGEDLVQWLEQVAASLNMDFMALVPGVTGLNPEPPPARNGARPAAGGRADPPETRQPLNHG